MIRLFALFGLLPSLCSADVVPRPTMFTYDATFAQCITDPERLDLAATCADAITAAYTLNRAVAMAAQACGTTALAECSVPFEEQGLPHIAVQIAADVGCDRGGLAALRGGRPLDDNHCITIIADVLRDEGVVAFEQDITCLDAQSDCHAIARLHYAKWRGAVSDLSDTDLTRDRVRTILDDCNLVAVRTRDTYECGTNRLVSIWADLIQQRQDQ